MADEEIRALVFKHCYATTAAGGWIFAPELDRGLSAFVNAIREQALEEAAEFCDDFEATVLKSAGQYTGQDVDCYHETAVRCAAAIRTLKDKNA
jgi:hypothetical protein